MAQFPEFYQQYLQHLSGRLAEVRRRAHEIAADASAKGLDVESYIATFTGSPAHALEGARMAETLALSERLSVSYNALSTSDPWSRLPVFLRQFDGGLAGDTLRIFEPAVPLSTAGLLYALLGAGVGLLFVAGSAKAVTSLRRPSGPPTGEEAS
jgi:hypothetical protein